MKPLPDQADVVAAASVLNRNPWFSSKFSILRALSDGFDQRFEASKGREVPHAIGYHFGECCRQAELWQDIDPLGQPPLICQQWVGYYYHRDPDLIRLYEWVSWYEGFQPNSTAWIKMFLKGDNPFLVQQTRGMSDFELAQFFAHGYLVRDLCVSYIMSLGLLDIIFQKMHQPTCKDLVTLAVNELTRADTLLYELPVSNTLDSVTAEKLSDMAIRRTISDVLLNTKAMPIMITARQFFQDYPEGQTKQIVKDMLDACDKLLLASMKS